MERGEGADKPVGTWNQRGGLLLQMIRRSDVLLWTGLNAVTAGDREARANRIHRFTEAHNTATMTGYSRWHARYVPRRSDLEAACCRLPMKAMKAIADIGILNGI